MRRLLNRFKAKRRHARASEMPSSIRQRMYSELLHLQDQEKAVAELLGLSVRPRLSVIDEACVAIIRPADRENLELDNAMHTARQEHRSEQAADSER